MKKWLAIALLGGSAFAQVQLGRNVQIGGAGAGSGCPTGTLTPDGQLIYNDAGACASSPNILVSPVTNSQTPSAATQSIVINNATNVLGDDHVNLQLNSAVDPGNNYSFFSPHLWKMRCSESGTSLLGCSLNLFDDDSDATPSTGGAQPIWIQMFATQPGDHPSYAGITMDESIADSVVTTAGMEGLEINGPIDTFHDSHFDHVNGITLNLKAGTEALNYEHGVHITTPSGSSPASNYCDFWATNQNGLAPRLQLGCGPTFANTFFGPIAVNDGTGQGGTFNALEGTVGTLTPTAAHDILYADATAHCIQYSANGGAFACLGSGGSSAFSALTGSTNTTAAMLVGSGASLAPTGTGTIQATNIASTLSAGTGIAITGSGTTASPYSIAATGGSSVATVASSETVASSATPTFSTSFNVSYNVLTANVTSFTLAAGSDGQAKTLTFCQNGTGGFTVTPPANVHGFFTVSPVASKCNSQHFNYSTAQTAWLADSAGVIGE